MPIIPHPSSDSTPPDDELGDLRRLNWALGAYARCTSILIHTKNLNLLVSKVCEAIISQEAYRIAAVGVAELDDTKSVRILGLAGPASAYFDDIHLSWSEDQPDGHGPAGMALRTGKPFIVNDCLNAEMFAPWRDRAARFGLRSTLTMPFSWGETAMGVLIVHAGRLNAFGADELALFERLAEEVGYAMSRDAERLRLEQAENAHRASDAQYQQLFNAAGSGIVVADRFGRYLDANPAMCRFLGYEREELLGLMPEDLMDPEEAKFVAPALEKIAAGDVYQRVWRLHRKDGDTLIADIISVGLPDGTFLATVRDMTAQAEAEMARSAAEQALRKSEARYRSLFDNAPEGMVLISQEGPYLDVNPSACRMLRYRREDLIGKTGRDLVDEAQMPFLDDAAEEIARHGVTRRRWRLRRADGTWVAAEVVSTQLPDGPYMSVITDLTDRDAVEAARATAEAQLRASEERYRGLFDCAPDGIIVIAEDGSYIDINPSACEMLGYGRDDFIGLRGPDLIGEAQMRLLSKSVESIAAHGVFRGAWRLKRRDGSWIPTEVLTTQMPDNTFVSIIRDVTDRERAEAARQAAEEVLRDTQAKLARAGRAATLGEVVATISHEINQPLAAIVTNSDAAQRWLGHNPPNLDAARESLTHIARDSRRASQVIRRTREFLAGKGLERAAFDLNLALEEVMSLSRTEQRRAGVVTRLSLLPELPRVDADRTQIQQVALNLALNALDAMAAQDDTVRLLTVATSRLDADWALVEVADTGPGLDAETSDKLFDQFFTTKVQGTGVGLSISHSIILAHGARIWAENGPAGGAVFRFTVPLAAGATS